MEGYGRLRKHIWDGLGSGESGVHSNRPERPLFPCPDIPDNLANIGLIDFPTGMNRGIVRALSGEENAKTPANIDLSAMSAMSGLKYSSGGRE